MVEKHGESSGLEELGAMELKFLLRERYYYFYEIINSV